MRVINVAIPAEADEVGAFDSAGFWARNVTDVGDGYCYLTNSDAGVMVIDISDPAAPDSITRFDTPGSAYYAVKNDDYMYVADAEGGVRVLDITDPVAPEEIFFVNTSYAQHLEIAGDYAYVADGRDGGLNIMDISNPERPVTVSSLVTEGDAYGASYSDGYVYVADGDNGLVVIDVQDVNRPRRMATFSTDMGADGLALKDHYAFVAQRDRSGRGGLGVVDLANPRSPRDVAFIPLPGAGRGLTIDGDIAYIGCGPAGVVAVDISDPEDIEDIGYYNTPGYGYPPIVIGELLYIGDGSNFGIYDPSGLAVQGFSSPQPQTFELLSAFPNPFNDHTSVMFGLPEASDVSVNIYDSFGRFVHNLTTGNYSAGYHNITWNARHVPAGVYLIRMQTSEFESIRKVSLIR